MPLGVSIFILFPYHWTSQALVYSPQQCVSVSVQSVMKSWNMKVVLKAVLTTLWSLLHGFLSLCSDAVVETSLTAQLQSLQPHYVTGGRKIDMLLCSLYIQHWRAGNIFVSPSLSHCSLVYNMLSGRIPPIRSLWKLLCQSSGLIKCIYFLIHFTCWGK